MKSIVPKRKALFVILAAATLTVMACSIISSVISLMQGNLQGADSNNIRFVITTHALFIAIFSPVFGIVIDKVGAKNPLFLVYFSTGSLGLQVSSLQI